MQWTSLLIYNEGKDVSIIGIFYLPSKHFLRKNNTKIKNNRPAHFTSSLFFCVAAYQKQRAHHHLSSPFSNDKDIEVTIANYPRIVATCFTRSSVAFGFLTKHFASSS